MATQIAVDSDLCVGTGDCVFLAPEAFVLDESRGVAVVLPDAADADPALLFRAARQCPTLAIRLEPDGEAPRIRPA